jgi:hypothetical protein
MVASIHNLRIKGISGKEIDLNHNPGLLPLSKKINIRTASVNPFNHCLTQTDQNGIADTEVNEITKHMPSDPTVNGGQSSVGNHHRPMNA